MRAARRRARGAHLWQWRPEWRTLLAECFASPWSGQQAESFVLAKNRERTASNLERKKGDELTLIIEPSNSRHEFKNKASNLKENFRVLEKKAAAAAGSRGARTWTVTDSGARRSRRQAHQGD